VDQDRKHPREPQRPSSRKSETQEMRRPAPSQDAMAAAMEVVQRLAAEAEAEESVSDFGEDTAAGGTQVCAVC